MKKIFIVTAMSVVVCLSSYANPDNSGERSDKETPKQIRKEKREERKQVWVHSADPFTRVQFNNDFPDAKDMVWAEAAFSEVTFKDGDIVKTAYYDTEHKLVGTTEDVNFSTLPAKAKRYIGQKYSGFKVEKVIRFDDNEANNTDMLLLSSPFEDEDNYFPVLSKGSRQIILKVTMNGDVSFFQNYK